MKYIVQTKNLIFTLLGLAIMLGGCESGTADSEKQSTMSTPVQAATLPAVKSMPEPEIENKSYLFDVSEHTIEELEAVLTRAEQVSRNLPDSYRDLEIVMVLHGPDIDWFTQQNYEQNRDLVALAERLDSNNVIDMQVCEQAMASRGVSSDDIPDFIEPVPYAPAAMNALIEQGYTIYNSQ